MIENFELGYTPANLKALRQKYELTQKQVVHSKQPINNTI